MTYAASTCANCRRSNHGYGNKPDGHYRGDENPGPYLPTKVGLVDRNNGQHHNDDLAL
jgi:hypothetical protein